MAAVEAVEDNLSVKAAGNESVDGRMTACDDEIGRWTVTKIGYFGTYIRYLPTNPTLIPCHLIVTHHRYL